LRRGEGKGVWCGRLRVSSVMAYISVGVLRLVRGAMVFVLRMFQSLVLVAA
jgi:hypothetical protein